MFKKLYDEIIKYIKGNYKFLLILLVILLMQVIKVPYLIVGSGGIEDIDKRVLINNEYSSKGKIYASYVTEYQGTVTSYLYGLIMHYDFYKTDQDYSSNEDYTSSSLMFNESNENAIYVAYKASNRPIKITKEIIYVNGIVSSANTDILVGDQIININNKNINTIDDVKDSLKDVKVGQKINIKVKNDGKLYNRYAYIINYENRNIIGFSYSYTYKFNYDDYKIDETVGYGPSGGLMTTLLVYNKINKQDITNGMKVAGTGTIDIDGNVGSIGGIKWKVIGASKKHVDVFFVPEDNYLEALKTKKDYNLDINLVKVSTFNDALKYLQG